jgi:hypothetical protein
VVIASCCVSPVWAQDGAPAKDQKIWALEGLRAGYCISFLTDPASARDELDKSLRLLRADGDSALHPALRQVIQSQPEFAAWSPSSLCFYYTDAVRLGSRRIVEHDARKAQMLGIWSIGAVEQGSQIRRDLVLGMYASRERLRTAAAADLVQLEEAEAAFRAGADTVGDQYSQRIGKTLLVWIGRTAGDSARVPQPVRESWRVPGRRRMVWSADLSLMPTWARDLVGSLRVEGKGDLAKSLRASPIRFVGPFYHGGRGQLRFSR